MKHYDFILILLTVVLLGLLGALSLVGTGYSWVKSLSDAQWTSSPLYAAYLQQMNLTALPLILGLGLVAGACIPRRILSRYSLLAFSVCLLLLTLVLGIISSAIQAAAFLLFASTALQLMVTARAGYVLLRGINADRLRHLGSGLLHLGFLVFALDVILMQQHPLHMPVFWASLVCIMAGSFLALYSEDLGRSRIMVEEGSNEMLKEPGAAEITVSPS